MKEDWSSTSRAFEIRNEAQWGFPNCGAMAQPVLGLPSMRPATLQFACSLASPILLAEMVAWLGQPCYVFNEGSNSITDQECECSSGRYCMRDNVKLDGSSRVSDYPLWFSYGMMMALSLFVLNFIGAIAAGQAGKVCTTS